MKDDIMGWTNNKILKNKEETEETEETEEPKDNSNEIKKHNKVLNKIQIKFDKKNLNRLVVNSETKKIKLISEVSSDDEFIFKGTNKIHDLELFFNLHFSSSAHYIYLVPTDQADYILFFILTSTNNNRVLYYHILSKSDINE